MNLVSLSKTVRYKNSELWTGCTSSIQYHSLVTVSVMPLYNNNFQSSIILTLKMEGHGIIITLHGYVTVANCTSFGGSGKKRSCNYRTESGKEKLQCVLLIRSVFPTTGSLWTITVALLSACVHSD